MIYVGARVGMSQLQPLPQVRGADFGAQSRMPRLSTVCDCLHLLKAK
jgi:hypothetical protein